MSSETDSTCSDYGVSDMGEGIMNIVRPAIHQLDAQVEATKQSQSVLASTIEELADLLRDISQEQPSDLDVFVKKLDDSRRRVAYSGKVLESVQERITRLQRDVSRKSHMGSDVNPPLRANDKPYTFPPFHGGDHPQILHSIQGYNSDAECRSPSNSATVFVEFSENILEDYSDGARTPLKSSCAPCKSGTRFSYAPLARDQDLDELAVGDIRDIVVGGYRCVNNSNLCVEATDGTYYRANSDSVVIWPVPFLKNKKPVMLAILDPTESLRELIGNRIEFGRDQIQSWAPMTYKKGHDYTYIEIEGISCNSCNGAMNHCPLLSAPPKKQLRLNDWRVAGANIRPPGEAPVAPVVPPVIERTGYSYNGPETYSSDTYGKPQTSVTEEPYSNLGYEENSVYVQPDGMNPYLDPNFEKNQETSTQSNTEKEMERESDTGKALRYSVFRSSPAPIPLRASSQDRDDGREIEILDRQVIENGPINPTRNEIRRAPLPNPSFKMMEPISVQFPQTTPAPLTLATVPVQFVPFNRERQNFALPQTNPVIPRVQSAFTSTSESTTAQPPRAVTLGQASRVESNSMPTFPPVLPQVMPSFIPTFSPFFSPAPTLAPFIAPGNNIPPVFSPQQHQEIPQTSTTPARVVTSTSTFSPAPLFTNRFPSHLSADSQVISSTFVPPTTVPTTEKIPETIPTTMARFIETTTAPVSTTVFTTRRFIFPVRREETQFNVQPTRTFTKVDRLELSPTVPPTRTFAPLAQEPSDPSKLFMFEQLRQNIGLINQNIPPQMPTLPPQRFVNIPNTNVPMNIPMMDRNPNSFLPPQNAQDFGMSFVPQGPRFPELLSPVEQSLLINSIIPQNMNGPMLFDRGQVQPRELSGPAGPPGLSSFFVPSQIQDANMMPRRPFFPMRSMEQPQFTTHFFSPTPPSTTATTTTTMTTTEAPTTTEASTTPFEFKIMEPQPLIGGPVPPPKETAFEQKEVQLETLSKDSPPSQVPTWQWLMDHPARMRALLRRRKMLL
ncbi:unnamed protein product [Auanema sp. JU1783]|nr:unnamed protein product [Auanema sp. JU1783]